MSLVALGKDVTLLGYLNVFVLCIEHGLSG